MTHARTFALVFVLIASMLGAAHSAAAQDIQPIEEPGETESGEVGTAAQPIIFDCWGGLSFPYEAFTQARVDARTWCNNAPTPMAVYVDLYRSGSGHVGSGAAGSASFVAWTVETSASYGCLDGYYWADGLHIVWLPSGPYGTTTASARTLDCRVNPVQNP